MKLGRREWCKKVLVFLGLASAAKPEPVIPAGSKIGVAITGKCPAPLEFMDGFDSFVFRANAWTPETWAAFTGWDSFYSRDRDRVVIEGLSAKGIQ